MALDPLTCEDLVELVTDYIEEMLSQDEKQRFEDHLDGCSGCRAYVEQMRQTIRLTNQLTPESIPSEARDELLSRFREWKHSQQDD